MILARRIPRDRAGGNKGATRRRGDAETGEFVHNAFSPRGRIARECAQTVLNVFRNFVFHPLRSSAPPRANTIAPPWRCKKELALVLRVAGTVTLSFVASCSVGPDFTRPLPPEVHQFTATPLPETMEPSDARSGGAQRFVPGGDIPAQWWSLFHEPALDALIAQALKSNPDLQSAQAALREAKENIYAQKAAFFPTVGGSLVANRNLNSAVLSPTLFDYTPYFDLYSAQLTADWTLDIWGGNRRAVEALRATADAQHFQVEATYLTLTSALVVAAIQEASLRAQIASTQKIIGDETRALDAFQRQLSLGQISGADVAAQRAALAQSRQSLSPLQKQLAQQPRSHYCAGGPISRRSGGCPRYSVIWTSSSCTP